MTKLSLTLRYDRGVGDLAPYFDGLAVGLARATHCAACERTWFPPRLVCSCRHARMQWIHLPGTGVIRTSTETTSALPFDGAERRLVIALVAMEGADNLALGRVDGAAGVRSGQRVRLIADNGMRGGIAWCAVFEVMP